MELIWLPQEPTMLVLARKLNETICIGNEVRVTVLQIRQGRVRLGIEAPAQIRVRRDEIQESPAREFLEIDLELTVGSEAAGAW
jgi:carbon storage regulator